MGDPISKQHPHQNAILGKSAAEWSRTLADQYRCDRRVNSQICGLQMIFGCEYGDPLGTNDPIGEQRGILLFQDRSAPGVTISFGGVALWVWLEPYTFICSLGSGDGKTALPETCDPNGYSDTFNLGGHANP